MTWLMKALRFVGGLFRPTNRLTNKLDRLSPEAQKDSISYQQRSGL